jgi:hypothetical protein
VTTISDWSWLAFAFALSAGGGFVAGCAAVCADADDATIAAHATLPIKRNLRIEPPLPLRLCTGRPINLQLAPQTECAHQC